MKYFFPLICIFVFGEMFGEEPQLPVYKPTPVALSLRVPVVDSATGVKFKTRSYLILGDANFEKAVVLDGTHERDDTESFLEKHELYRFMSKLRSMYRNVKKPEDILAFSKVENPQRYSTLLEQHWDKVKAQYNSLSQFEVFCAWYHSPVDVNTLVRIIPEDGEGYFVNLVFTMTERGWLLKSGFLLDDRFAQDLEAAVYSEGGFENVSIIPISEIPAILLPGGEDFEPIPIMEDVVP